MPLNSVFQVINYDTSLRAIDAGHTRRDAALRVQQKFEAVDRPLAGVILNMRRRRDSRDYGDDRQCYTTIPAKRSAS